MAELAARQNGVVSRDQLRRLGLSKGQIETARASGLLHPIFHGVFAVGHGGIDRRGRMRAALLACGRSAAVSHMAAAELHGLTGRSPVLIDVTSASQAGRKIQGLRWHRAPRLQVDEVTSVDGIACTTVSRTLVDVAGTLGEKTLRGLIEEAAVKRRLDLHEIDRVLGRGRRRGAPMLRRLLRPWRRLPKPGQNGPTLRSRLEARFLSRVAEAGLPLPEVNVVLTLEGHRFEIDFLWAEERLAIETDGEETHGTAPAFQRDRWRDQVLLAAGYRAGRVSWRQIADDPAAVVERIGRALERR